MIPGPQRMAEQSDIAWGAASSEAPCTMTSGAPGYHGGAVAFQLPLWGRRAAPFSHKHYIHVLAAPPR